MVRLAFVTGASGFVGRHLVNELVGHGWRVRALVRRQSATKHLEEVGAELYRGDLLDSQSLIEGLDSVTAVFHLAAVTAATSDAEYERANADGTRAVVDAIRAAATPPVRLVYLSSYAAGGPAVGDEPRLLAEAPAPLTAYGRTKLAGEIVARGAEEAGTGVVAIRAPVVYGPGDRALLPYFRLVRGRLAPAPGGEDRKLHLIFAPDLALALRNAADAPPALHAVADPTVYRWSEVVDAIAAGVGRRPIPIRLPAALVRTVAALTETAGRLGGRATAFNRQKAEEMLASNWTCDLTGSDVLLPSPAVTPLVEGIEHTVRWYIRQGWL